ncbi:hypothetical protein [Jannaschia donghaensis]|uniref:EF-hand domain-containing protein n=1 Tax=Jannaschia donghaensis TaxID=420998 RepID=A0A0M6YGW0_9RHOB|nr:hypothetical protein [Jannaschia donghaensis]CTQ49581.1 hypothetical protein JDO7802_01595 [Jannaschia donghaensis]
MARAQQRAQAIAQILRFDTNGDLTISPDEATRQAPFLRAGDRAELTLVMAGRDPDGMSVSDIARLVEPRMPPRQNGEQASVGDPMLYDVDGDGRTTVAEVQAVIAAVEALPPVDAQRSSNPRTRIERRLADAMGDEPCTLPPASDEATVLLLSAYNATALSTVTVAGQDKTTYTAEVIVEPGETPLYVVASAYEGMIWRFTGATDRIETFVGMARADGLGTTGLPSDRVTFVPERGCLPGERWDSGSGAALRAKAALAKRLDHPVAAVVGSYSIDRISLPSGTEPARDRRSANGITVQFGNGDQIELQGGRDRKLTFVPDATDDGGYARLLRQLNRFYPGGVIQIDPKDVTASGQVAPYDILPQQAGLLQLLERDLIEPMSNGTYRITAPIPRFPAGLYGGHSVRFLLADGVPLPEGEPGHSEVIDGATGDCVSGARCRIRR